MLNVKRARLCGRQRPLPLKRWPCWLSCRHACDFVDHDQVVVKVDDADFAADLAVVGVQHLFGVDLQPQSMCPSHHSVGVLDLKHDRRAAWVRHGRQGDAGDFIECHHTQSRGSL